MIWWLGIILMLLTFLVVAIDILFIPTAILTILSVFSYLSYLIYVYLQYSKPVALILFGIFIIVGGGGVYLILRYKWWQILSHNKPLAKDESLYTSLDLLQGQTAKTISELRPSGKIVIQGRRYDALAQSSLFIGKGVLVKVSGTSGSQLIVKTLPS